MGAADFAWADGLRRTNFPPGRNIVPAHITLFHHLPPALLDEIGARMKMLCKGPAPAAMLDGVINLGGGVAYRIASPDLLAMRADLADHFQGLLIPQDRAPPRLHITVQNKVAAGEAHALAAALRTGFRPRPLVIAGLAAWYYRDGPWELALRTSFRG